MNWKDLGSDFKTASKETFGKGINKPLTNTGKRKSFIILSITLIFAIYAKISGEYKPLAYFVLVMCLIFLFNLVNSVLGKLSE